MPPAFPTLSAVKISSFEYSCPPVNSLVITDFLEVSVYGIWAAPWLSKLALTNRHHFPPLLRKRTFRSLIPPFISFEFRYPKIHTGLGQARERAPRMPVPETSMYENSFPRFSENKIRVARQAPSVQPVSVSERKDELADQQLRPRIL